MKIAYRKITSVKCNEQPHPTHHELKKTESMVPMFQFQLTGMPIEISVQIAPLFCVKLVFV